MKTKKKIIVPISYFNGESNSKLLEIDIETKTIKEVFNHTPNHKSKVNGKGFTQIEHIKEKNILLVADYNQFHVFDANNYKIIISVSSNIMNDIHGIKYFNNLIIIVNTGFDSIEIYNLEGKFIQSINLLSFDEALNRFSNKNINLSFDSYYNNDNTKPFNQRVIKDKFHLNNCTIIDNKLIATSFTKKTLIDLSPYREIASPLEANIHDCVLYDNKIWITSVDGKIYFRNKNIDKFSDFKEYVDLFNIGIYYGWCRGLYFSDGFVYIGITEINSDISQKRWNTNIPIEKTKTGIIKLNFKNKEIVNFYNLSDKNISRVFGFIIK
jgi:hypothetical protein